jgi:threonine/homoserine/homoserine lactone efflux protein
MNPDLLPAFALATLTFAVMPGPALLYTAAQTVARGRRAGFWAVAGIHVGGWAHVLAAAAGLSAVFRHAPDLYLALKLAGAAYLVWLGLRLIMTPTRPDGAAPVGGHAGAQAAKSARRAFLDSVLVEVLNPKAALFFLAFLPQFVDPGAGWAVWAQFLVLGAGVNLAFSAADVATVFAAAAVTGAARRSPAGLLWTQRAGGAALCALGARLALARD